jgi:CubicO group peptidase (beta-lactamase class C family)
MRNIVEISVIVFIVFVIIFWAYSSSISSKNAKLALNKIQSNQVSYFFIKSNIEKINKIDNFFQQEYKRGQFAGTILLSIKGQVVYKNSYGYANRKNKIPITTNTFFQIGSMSKQFTAVAILQLVSKGIINLNDEVTKFYPNFPYKGITIRMLLTHKSGLPNYIYQFEESKEIDKTKLISNQEMVKYFIKNNEKEYAKPGKCYQYSNTGYALLAAIIEKVTNMSFEEYVKKNIFEPIGMKNSFFYTDLYKGKVDSILHIATGYISPSDEAGFFYLNGILGDKGMFSSLDELYKWDISLYKATLLPKNWIDSALTIQTKTNKKNIYYGYGWKLYYLNDTFPIQFHSGWWQGYQSIIMRIPSDTITLIVLKNKKTQHPVNQKAIIDFLYPNNNFWNKDKKVNNEVQNSFQLE